MAALERIQENGSDLHFLAEPGRAWRHSSTNQSLQPKSAYSPGVPVRRVGSRRLWYFGSNAIQAGTPKDTAACRCMSGYPLWRKIGQQLTLQCLCACSLAEGLDGLDPRCAWRERAVYLRASVARRKSTSS